MELFINREGFVEHLESLFELSLSTEVNIYVTDKCLKRLKLERDDEKFQEEVEQFKTQVFDQKIIEINSSIRKRARHLRLIDMDSAEEIICAVDNGCDAIVTCNPNNFSGANLPLPVWTVESLILNLVFQPFHRECSEITFQSTVDDYGNSEEVSLDWMTTSYLKVIEELKQTENKRYFYHAVQSLFDSSNPESITFFSSITRLLRQYRLSGTYEAKDIIAEAYAINAIRLDEGAFIEISIDWLKRTCLNVIREFKRYQMKAYQPKLDGDLLEVDAMEEIIVLEEEIRVLHLAYKKLSSEEELIETLSAASHQYGELLEEYSVLNLCSELSDEVADRLDQIYAETESSPMLKFLLTEMDHIINQRLGLLTDYAIETYKDQQSWLRERLEQSPLEHEHCREIQRMLAESGFYAGPIDGVIGCRSTQALKQLTIYMQERLCQRGFYNQEIDGFFSTASSQALKAFQQSRSLADSGVPNRETLIALRTEE